MDEGSACPLKCVAPNWMAKIEMQLAKSINLLRSLWIPTLLPLPPLHALWPRVFTASHRPALSHLPPSPAPMGGLWSPGPSDWQPPPNWLLRPHHSGPEPQETRSATTVAGMSPTKPENSPRSQELRQLHRFVSVEFVHLNGAHFTVNLGRTEESQRCCSGDGQRLPSVTSKRAPSPGRDVPARRPGC